MRNANFACYAASMVLLEGMMTSTPPLRDEDGIVWEIDIATVDYVRELLVGASTRRRPIP
jgi:hypothetical protein